MTIYVWERETLITINRLVPSFAKKKCGKEMQNLMWMGVLFKYFEKNPEVEILIGLWVLNK